MSGADFFSATTTWGKRERWRQVMAFDESLADRIRDALARQKGVEEKKMFGGVGFLLHGNMLVGVWKESLVVRLGPDNHDECLPPNAEVMYPSLLNREGRMDEPQAWEVLGSAYLSRKPWLTLRQ